MEPTLSIIKSKVTPALIEEYLNENPFVKLIDTLLLTVKNVTFGIGKISKTLSDTDILEFIIEMPVINTNVIIQYDLKIKEQSVKNNFYLGNIPETIWDIKKKSDEYNKENVGELQVTQYDSSLAVVHNSTYNNDEMIIPCKENLNNHEEDREIAILNVASIINEDSSYSGSHMKNSSSSSDYGNASVSKERYHCSVCGKSFSRANDKKRHERIHTGERPYSCSVCGKSFVILSAKNAHERIHSGEKPYSCSVCGKSFTAQSNKIAHEKIHTEDRRFSCTVCGKSFKKQSNKISHEQMHIGEKSYSCRICDKSFNQERDRNAHERIHSRERPYSRENIPETILKKEPDGYNNENVGELQVTAYDSSRAVINISKYNNNEMIISCKENLKYHEEDREIPNSNAASDINEERLYIGSDMKNSSCSDYVATNGNNPVSKKRYHCRRCKKSFSSLSHKNVHKRIHTDERPYSCRVCGKSFLAYSRKITHETVHSEEKPFACAICGKSYKTRQNKKKHERTHTFEKTLLKTLFKSINRKLYMK